MKRNRRITNCILSLLLVVCLLPVGALAASGSTGELEWTLSGGTLVITGHGAMPSYSDESMAPWYDYAASITRVSVGEGVTGIGGLAFYGCDRVTAVSLPSTVTTIGQRAFKNCTALTNIRLPAGLTAIGEAAFEGCEALRAVSLPEGLRSIGSYAFYRCSALTTVTVPESVTSMGMVVFAYCSGLMGAEIRCPISRVPDWTFYGCTALNAVSLPDTVADAGDYAFHNCAALTEIHYSGDGADALLDSIRQDDTALASGAAVIPDGTYTGGSSGTLDISPDNSAASSTSTTITDSGNATIVDKSQTDYVFTVDGRETALGDLMGEDSVGVSGTVGVDSTSKTELSATVNNSDGWAEVMERIDTALSRGDEGKTTVEAEVSIAGTTVAGDDISSIAGKDVTLEVSTEAGDRWRIDGSAVATDDLTGKKFDLHYSMEQTEEKTIDAEGSYTLKFDGGVVFETTVGIALPEAARGDYATLYTKGLSGLSEVQTVMVDDNGDAWFRMDSVSSRGSYLVALNAAGVDTSDALVPHTLYEQYGIDEGYTLSDAEGNLYAVGERESRWGLTGKRFALYVGLAIGGVVLVVTIVMTTMHIIKKSRVKVQRDHAAPPPVEEPPLDEEALRLQIMQEMLEERRGKSGKES